MSDPARSRIKFKDRAPTQEELHTNRVVGYALDPTARSRLNTVSMATMLLGGAFVAGNGGLAFAQWGRSGTCIFCTALALIAGLFAKAASND